MKETNLEPADGGKDSTGCGCGFAIVVLIIAFVVFATFFGGDKVKITDGVAFFEEHPGDFTTAEMISTNIVEHVYDVAKKHPEVKKVVVTISWDKSRLADKYGREPKEDALMGAITVDDLDEVRRFEDSAYYSAKVHEQFAEEIRGMPYARLLRSK